MLLGPTRGQRLVSEEEPSKSLLNPDELARAGAGITDSAYPETCSYGSRP
jgi:hypothetical protein